MTKNDIIELKEKIVKGYNLSQTEAIELSNSEEKQTNYASISVETLLIFAP